MARSSISIINENGSVDSIVSNWDGLLTENGAMLVTHYNNKEKVRELIDLGNVVYLEKEIHPKGQHSEKNPEAGVTVFEFRDGENLDSESSHYNNVLDFLSEGALDTYNYIFKEKNQRWYFTDTLHVRMRNESQESSPLTPNDVVLQLLLPLVKNEMKFVTSILKDEFLQFEKEKKVAKDYRKLTKDLNNSSPLEIKKTKMKI